jgi:hypothetical protein
LGIWLRVHCLGLSRGEKLSHFAYNFLLCLRDCFSKVFCGLMVGKLNRSGWESDKTEGKDGSRCSMLKCLACRTSKNFLRCLNQRSALTNPSPNHDLSSTQIPALSPAQPKDDSNNSSLRAFTSFVSLSFPFEA